MRERVSGSVREPNRCSGDSLKADRDGDAGGHQEGGVVAERD